MRPTGQVLVGVDGVTVPGLLLKWSRDELTALVTFELDGRVETQWVSALMVTEEPT